MLLQAGASDKGKRLDAFLHERLSEFSRSRLQTWIKKERVLVNGSPLRASYLLHGTERIEVDPLELPPLKAQAEEMALDILYEDADLVVVNKAAGMVVHAGAGHDHGTLVNALLYRFGTLSSINADLRPGIVHRLDRDTSGVLVVARTDQAHRDLARQFHDREVTKLYLALVHGKLNSPTGQITTPISRDPIRRTRMITGVLQGGRSALTEYRVLEELDAVSYLSIRIGTGRTHQIRVHLASLRHPIVGDTLYGAPKAGLGRFFLHAHRLSFRSPSTGEVMTFESPLPPQLAQTLETARTNHG
jgi:23S rRNA pseudouridine1911/1915/1917 synthase